MDLQLTGRRAIVTGGSRGIGKAVARALVTRGTEATPHVLAEQAERQGLTLADLEARIGKATPSAATAAEVAALVTWLASALSVAVTGDVIACGGGVKGPIFC
jgi:NAD(P)-dependent dehydrogenase (short-subunit alcohol dehydrogenase family)